ncbi:MAG: FAD-dependent oxidoreductase [Myxococcales bacterium]|nr:FAD-dependent oxidoreductase [Myxococcales bacterium]
MAVVVVGGGLVGLAVALELARRDVAVTCLERAVPGAEASSAAAGILAPRVEAHGDAAVRALGVRSLAMYEAWLDSLGTSVGFRRSGALVVGDVAPDEEAVSVQGTQLARLAPGLAARRAWWLADEALVDTRRLVGAVREAANAAGVCFRAATVHGVGRGGLWLVDGEHIPGEVVVCAGAWSALVGGLEEMPIRPVRGQLVALGDLEVTSAVVFGAGGYLVPRHDELVAGSTVEDVGFARGVTAAGVRDILDHAIGLVPSLGTAPLLRTWSNFRPGSPDGRPMVGARAGVWLASGHYRNGVLLAPLTAQLLVNAMLSGDPLPAAWAPDRF